ncbi:MAG: 1-(5-phosphoribosyl)-5-[(5-phosphoribosylamino)methylideneamino] imidazole-4-carboxamide isomerase [Flammeovirgaceae bacterium]|nr:1-(5-phosphoribosyl)-5-[(5-phosphoribosylamino)methylideneamino] imidazole-4-carboxamide isomerase [Flammeovirgaceae bacterium]MDW8287037.1 1-(5-phosphoribosyl)-5-[(5-phosphoribosylamino)methylideneamino] imidazole-4-carboxamide isomerase [Flammeovirgaceae bacterium]
MIEIIPSISVIGGKCVRLKQGDYDSKIVYEESVLDFAKKFEEHGIRRVHFIDLDGAREGKIVNYETLRMVKGHTNLQLNFGGGVNSDGDLANAFEYGAVRVTIGTLAINQPDLFTSWLVSFGNEKIVLSADTLDGKIRVRGWQKKTEVDLFDHIEYYYNRGIKYVKCSDVARDGALEGPNFKLYEEIHRRFPEISILASGGISSMDDIKRLEDIGCFGAIVGKAIYQNKISMKEIADFNAKRRG